MAEEKKKEGFIGKLWHSLRGGKDESNEEALGHFSVDIVKTTTLERRLEEYKDFQTYLEDVMVETDKKKYDAPELRINYFRASINGINRRLQQSAIPWGTAGESDWYSVVVQSWSIIYSSTLLAINSMDRLMQTKANPVNSKYEAQDGVNSHKQTIVDKVDYFFVTIFLPAAQLVAGISWMPRDITPVKVAMIQNIPQYQSGIQIERGKMPGMNK